MYLNYYQLKEYPFALTPNIEYFFRLYSHQAALNVLMIGIDNGEGFMAIIGEVGCGKTLLCRKLLHVCDQKGYVTAYIPNPHLDAVGVYKAFAQELEINDIKDDSPQTILNAVQDKLIDLYRQHKKVLFIIDEAQVMSDESLEALRLLSNLETKDAKLLQIILFAQPELDNRLKKHNLRQLRQRITFEHHLKTMEAWELKAYLDYRLEVAAIRGDVIKFTPSTYYLVHKASRGIPRLVNLLCHKALLIGYGLGAKKISARIMLAAIKDTASASKQYLWYYAGNILVTILAVGLIVEISYLIRMHL